MSARWPEVPLGEVLRKSETWISLSPEVTYKEVTVKLWGRGAVLRREVAGAEIGAERRLQVRQRQFILSRIDARNGAFGLIPRELDGAVVSSDFPVFDADQEKLLPEYLEWMSRTAGFVEACGAASEGTTNRVRLKENQFLRLSIALPGLAEQRRIVAKIELLAAKVEEARQLKRLTTGEGLALERAHTDRIYREAISKFHCYTLGEVCESVTDGDHLTPGFTEEGVPFIFVGNVSSGRLHFEGCSHVRPEYFESLKGSRKPRKGDVLYSAVGATLGVPAVVYTDQAFCFQRHIAILRPDTSRVLASFLWHMLRSPTVFLKAWESTTGSAQPTVPLRAIRALRVPMPDIEEQERIVALLDGAHARLLDLAGVQHEVCSSIGAMIPAILDRAFKGEL